MATSRAPAISWKSADVLRTTENGTPFMQDLFNIFSSLMLSLELRTYRQFFRRYDNSFLIHSAVTALHSLKVPNVTCKPDATNPFKTVVTTKIATYSMNRDAAENILHLFVKARLIEDATNPRAVELSDKSIYVITPKGLHVLESFAQANSADMEHITRAYLALPICPRLLYLPRHGGNDRPALSYDTILTVFRRFAGDSPNYSPQKFNTLGAIEKYNLWCKGVLLSRSDRAPEDRSEKGVHHGACFLGPSAMEWLCDFTSVSGKAEAALILVHFDVYGLIALKHHRPRTSDPAPLKLKIEVDKSGIKSIQEGAFFLGPKTVYDITAEGRRLAWGSVHPSPLSSPSSFHSSTADLLCRPPGLEERHIQPSQSSFGSELAPPQDVASDCLQDILHDSDLRGLFRTFSSGRPFDNYLSFIAGYEELQRSVLIPPLTVAQHRDLDKSAAALYNDYVRRWDPRQIRVDDSVRQALSDQFRAGREPAQAATPGQIQTTLGLYERVQTAVIKFLLTDVIPEFMRTQPYLSWLAAREKHALVVNPAHAVFGSHNTQNTPVIFESISQRAKPLYR